MSPERFPSHCPEDRLAPLAWLPLPFFVGAIGVLACLRPPLVYNPPYLLPALNILFLTLNLLLVALLAARSHLAEPSGPVLLLGSGALALSLAGVLAGLPLPRQEPNWAITIYHSGACLAAACHLGGALLGFRARHRLSPAGAWAELAGGYLAVGVAVVALAWATYLKKLPVFFVEGQGTTAWDRATAWSTAGMFALAGVLLGIQNRKKRSAFVFWYALGLGLIALGLVGVSFQRYLGSPLNWSGRAAQYLGGVYMLIAALTARRGRRWQITLAHALHEVEERYHCLVELCPDAILVHAERKIIFANRAAVTLWDAGAPEKLLGRDILDLIHPGDREVAARRIHAIQTYGITTPLIEEQIVRLDGRPVPVEVTGTRIDCQGRPAVQVVLRDATQRKRAEEALRQACDQLESRVRERTAELAQANAALRASNEQVRALAARLADREENERRGLARELHDQIGQALTAMGINLNVVRQKLGADVDEGLAGRLDDTIGQLEHLTDDVRGIMAELRPAVLDDYGLAAALRWYGEQYARRTGLRVETQAEELPARLPLATETALFRIAQEALINVAKHARARRVDVTLEATSHGVRLLLADDGVGFAPPAACDPQGQSGWGQLIMGERAAAVGGRLFVESAPGCGTRVIVEVGR